MRGRWVLLGLVALLAIGYALGIAVRQAGWLRTAPVPVVGVTATPAAGDDQVDVTVSSNDVPGCYGADQPFRAVVDSRWGEHRARNVVIFRWQPGAETGTIQVSAEGQRMQKALRPGQPFPDVNLKLPLDDRTAQLALTTFIFRDLDKTGRACFTWAQPPGTPRPQRLPPRPNTDA
jgi:hypothetical protein